MAVVYADAGGVVVAVVLQDTLLGLRTTTPTTISIPTQTSSFVVPGNTFWRDLDPEGTWLM